jgi:signal peptidase
MNNRSSQHIRNLQGGTGLILTEKERAPYALRDKRSDAVYFCAHTGTSMHPTLSELDLLEIKPYSHRPIRVGDVILFLLSKGDKPVVHRVVRISPEGIRTRGDGNNRVDTWILSPEDVIGQVVRAVRGKRRRPIYGGTFGRVWSLGVGGFKMLVRSLSLPYYLLARWGNLRHWGPIQKRMRIIAVNHSQGKELKLMLGRWVIGWRRPEGLEWQIRRPFRLFVDERSLPK